MKFRAVRLAFVSLLVMMLGLVAGGAWAGAQAQEFKLANGMRIIVQEDRRAPTVAHMVWYRVGSMDEQNGTTGVAHVLEHMMFKGTPKVKAGEFSRRVAALGGRDNAFTSRDATAYHQQVPANRLREVMELEADRFASNSWPDEEFRREIEVIKEERRQRTDDSPRAQLYEMAQAVLFTASPYRRPIIGWMNDIESLTPEEVREFRQRWYAPANAAVVVAGDVDVAQVRAWAEQYYGAIAPRAVPARKPRIEPPQNGPRRLEHRARSSQGYLSLMFKVPQFEASALAAETVPAGPSRDALALTVLAAVLDGYSGARLDRALTQGPKRLAHSAGAYNGLYGRGPQVFTLDGVPVEGRSAQEVVDALRAQVAEVAQNGVSAAELQRVKTQWIASETYKLDAIFNQARELGTAWLMGFPLDVNSRLVKHLRTITAQEVQQVAQRYFGDAQSTLAVLVPEAIAASAASAPGASTASSPARSSAPVR
jgi:zinc protease